MRLDEKEPVVVRRRERLVGMLEHDARRRNVEDHQPFDAVGVIRGQAMRDATAAVVARDREVGKAQRLHDLDLVLRHRALGVMNVGRAAIGLVGIAVAAKIGTYDGEAVRKRRRDLVPHRMRLRVTVKQKQRRPAAADGDVDPGASGRDLSRDELLEKRRHGQPSRSSRFAFAGSGAYGCAFATPKSSAAPRPRPRGTVN